MNAEETVQDAHVQDEQSPAADISSDKEENDKTDLDTENNIEDGDDEEPKLDNEQGK